MTERLAAQMAFLAEADRLKSVDRSNVLMDGSRPENSAEHSWHVALWAMVFADRCADDGDLTATLVQILLHDLVEIDAGDHPIHLPRDEAAIAQAEAQAATRIFGLLPPDQSRAARAAWDTFESGASPEAQFAKQCDHIQPGFQALFGVGFDETLRDVMRGLLTTGRPSALRDSWPEAHAHASALVAGTAPQSSADFQACLRFLAEADQLKTVIRASRLIVEQRFENTAEHSWHVALFAWVLAEYAAQPVNLGRVIQMLLVHDIVEIDAGDNPIHGAVDHAAQDAAEQAAADRLFGMLPPATGARLRALWEEFEARESADARFAKALDRTTTPIANLASDGGSWVDYSVTMDEMDARVGVPISEGAPALWDWLRPQIVDHFAKAQQDSPAT